MRQRRTMVPLVLILCLLVTGFTCKNKSLQSSAGVAASLKALQDSEINLYNVKQVTPEEHRFLQEGFLTLFQTDKSVRKCIYDSAAPGCVDAGIEAVNIFVNSKVNGIKNPDSKAALQVSAQAVISALNALKVAL